MADTSKDETHKTAEDSKSTLNDVLARIKRVAENCLQMSQMPLPDNIHVDGLKSGMEEIIELTKGITH